MKKTKLTRSLMAAVSIVALSAVMYGCVHNGGDDPEPMVEPMPEPMPEPDPGPTDLEETQAAALAAANAAMASATSADTAADGAEAATANIAAVQTNGTAAALADEARMYADAAMEAADDAKAASDDAAAATTGDAGEAAWRMAENAKDAAAAAAMTAGEKAEAAEAAAMMEVMVDGSTKSIGETSITIDGKTVTSGTAPNVVETGKTGDISAMSDAVAAVAAVAAVPDDATTIDIDETMAAVVAKPAIASRPIDVGVRYDSPDDSARVRLVTHYIGSGTVAGVYFGDGETAIAVPAADHAAYDHDNTDTDASPAVRILKASGMFYEATTAIDATGTVPATVGTGDDETANKGTPLYYYDVVTRNGDGAVTARTRTWLLRTGTLTAADGTVTHNYTPYTATNVATTLKNFPMAMAFEHLHYGVWNSLDENGSMIADLGTGFVAATADGSGMTGADMPNAGTATYNGQWVASVRGSGGGAVTAQDGNSTMTANFDKDTIKVELMSLATLEGKLSGDMFSGTKVTGVMSDKGDLAVSEDGSEFSGSFSGGFFGAKAAEAGGVFDYTSKDMAAGEFRGAFGGAKEEN